MSLSITFDDGCKTVYTCALPLMQNLGFKGTVFVSTDSLYSKNYHGIPTMSSQELKELVSLGWEIGSHGTDHSVLPRLPYETREIKIRESKEFLQRHGFRVSSFAYPYGFSDETTEKIVSKYYQCARSAFEVQGPYILEKAYLNPYCIPASHFFSFNFLKRIKRKNGWLTVVFHSISDYAPKTGYPCVSPQKFIDFLNNAREAGLESLTFVDAFDRFGKRKGIEKMSAYSCKYESLIARIWYIIDEISTLGCRFK